MKTLILNGSPRPHGDTAALLRILKENLDGEYRQIDAYRCNISPCIDCRYCKTHSGCAIPDEMQEVYPLIQECDNIVLASPIYFSEVTGRVLDVCSRLQTYFCARIYRGETPIPKPKRGAVLLAGGGDGAPEKAYSTACTLLHQMNHGGRIRPGGGGARGGVPQPGDVEAMPAAPAFGGPSRAE